MNFIFTGLGREYALAFAERGASVVGNVKVTIIISEKDLTLKYFTLMLSCV